MTTDTKRTGRPEGRRAKKEPERAHIKCGPLGPNFWKSVERAAVAKGESFSAYVRAAVLQRMKSDGRAYQAPKDAVGLAPGEARVLGLA